MRSPCAPSLTLLVVVLIAAAGGALAGPCALGDGSQATLVALLRLRHGHNCSRVSLQGLQQHAALLAAADAANAEAPAGALNIGVQVYDTCAEPDDAVKATLRALVANEGSCLRPPLFLGFVGPTDAASLSAVQRVTRVFELPHLLPFGDEASSALPVTADKHQQRTQALLSLVQRLGARSLLAVRTSEGTAARQADDLIAAAKAAQLCVVRPPLDAAGLSGLEDVSNGTLVVVLTGEAAELPAGLLTALPGRLPLLVAARAAGALPSTAASAAAARGPGAAPLLVLQDAEEPGLLPEDGWRAHLSQLPLWQQYAQQLSGDEHALKLTSVGDPSLAPLTYAVSLTSAAARAAQAARCRSQGAGGAPCAALLTLPRSEWRATLAAVTAFARHTAAPARRLRFHMDLPQAAQLLLWDPQHRLLNKVGHQTGKQLSVSDEAALSVPQLEVAPDASQCYGVAATAAAPAAAPAQSAAAAADAEGAASASPQPSVPVVPPEDDPLTALLGDDYTYDQMVGLLAGVSVAMLAVFALCVYVVYCSFRVSSDKSDKQSDGSGSPRRRGSSRRCRRRGSVTPRSSRRGSD